MVLQGSFTLFWNENNPQSGSICQEKANRSLNQDDVEDVVRNYSLK